MKKRIYLSPPHMGGDEIRLVEEVFASNWIAPVGPHVSAFESEFAIKVGCRHAAAVSSGTAALHLALRLVGVGPGDDVLCSTLTFVASASPILYQGGRPVFIDSDWSTWNMNPDLLIRELEACAKRESLPKAVVLVHLYGQPADIDPILAVCQRFEVPLIEDAAEALGAHYKGKAPGTFGKVGIYSFNGNKIITTSSGGMLVSDDEALVEKARFWATQARDPAPHYQHSELGYNYRMSNVLAAIGCGQLRVLDDRVAAKQRIFAWYQKALGDLPGLSFMPEPSFGRATRWLTCVTIDPARFGAARDDVLKAMEEENIEARPLWKPLHLQPIFSSCKVVGGEVAEGLFGQGLCLPSGSNMTVEDLDRVASVILDRTSRSL